LPDLDSTSALQAHTAGLSFALEAHAHAEDELLFTALEPHLGAQSGPLAVMRMEHDQITALLERLKSPTNLTQGHTLATQMLDLSRDHFQKEEQILFPLARQFLGEQELAELGRQWARLSPP
jgi:hemerythrin-like domain-containing protein